MLSTDQWLSLAAPAIIAIGIIVSATLLVKQMRTNYKMSIREKAISYSVYANKDLREARAILDEAFGPVFIQSDAIPNDRIDEIQKTDRKVELAILTILAHWENMALAIESGIADNEVCRNMVASSLIQNTRVFRGYIDKRRDMNPRYYMHLIKLRRRWEDELGKMPQIKFNPVLKI